MRLLLRTLRTGIGVASYSVHDLTTVSSLYCRLAQGLLLEEVNSSSLLFFMRRLQLNNAWRGRREHDWCCSPGRCGHKTQPQENAPTSQVRHPRVELSFLDVRRKNELSIIGLTILLRGATSRGVFMRSSHGFRAS